MKVYSHSDKGFTLIELLLVIAIVGILAGVILIGINPAQRMQEARDNIRKTDLKAIQKALEIYFVKNRSYPVSGCISAPTNPSWQCWNVNSPGFLMGANGKDYISTMPIDPRNYDSGLAYGTGADTSFSMLYTAEELATHFTQD